MDKRTKLAVGLTFGIPLTCLGSIFLALNSYASGFDRSGEVDLAKLRAHGFPTEVSDLKRPMVADEDNAAPLYRAFMKRIDADKDLKKSVDLVSSRWTENGRQQDKAEVQKAMLAVEVLVPEAEAIARRPQCDFAYDYSLGFSLLLPEFSYMRRVSSILRSHADLLDARGDGKGALATLALSRNVERHLAQGPFLIGVLVQVEERTRSDRALAELAYRHRKDEAFLTAAAKVANAVDTYPDLRRALGTEFVCSRISIRQIKSMKDLNLQLGVSDAPKGAFDMMDIGLVHKIADSRLAHAYVELEPGLPKDPRQWRISRKSLSDFDKRMEDDKDPLNTVNRVLLPVFANSGDAIGRWECSRTLLSEGIRLLREANGKAVSAPQLGSDPFSGRALRFLPEEEGFLIYSVGPNQVDDFGNRGNNSDDLALRFGPPR